MIKTTFDEAKKTIDSIMETENSYIINGINDFPTLVRFSTYGLSSAGVKMKFPASFINEISRSHYELANEVLLSRANDYFEMVNEKRKRNKNISNQLLIREFQNEVHGVLTDKYSIFDDDEVMDILKTSDYLMNSEEIWSDITPDHLHLRFISGNKLYVNGDSSPLSMAVFVDNSMVGDSSLKIRFGIYRWACTNGVISGLKEFSILKEVHHGTKDYAYLLSEALKNVEQYEQMMLKRVEEMTLTKSSIYNMTEEDAIRYIKDKLNIGKKDAKVIFKAYNEEYGGETKWDLCNAITFVAHNITDINSRLHYEESALRVA